MILSIKSFSWKFSANNIQVRKLSKLQAPLKEEVGGGEQLITIFIDLIAIFTVIERLNKL